jgi:hypothetical protein
MSYTQALTQPKPWHTTLGHAIFYATRKPNKGLT